jgi:predicted DCC family thiol-disulfide oxidoreductase YuxK
VARTELSDALYDALPILHALVAPIGWTFRPGAEFVEIVLFLTIAAGALGLIGLFTNAALLVFALGCAFLQSFLYSFGDFHHPEAVLIIALGLLALSPAGGALSVDDLRRRFRDARKAGRFLDFDLKRAESAFAAWPLKLTGWVFVLIYASGAYFKLRNAGLDWANGYTLSYRMMEDALRWDIPLGAWLSAHHPLMVGMSWLTLVFEATFVLAMLVPITRWIYVPLGASFHLGIYYTMGATFQGYVAAYSVFVPWRDGLERLARRFGRLEKRPVVMYDVACPLCIRSATFLRYWDWLERLEFRPLQDVDASTGLDSDELRREMHVVFPDGSVERGFFAFRRLLRELPPLWWLRPVFHLPGAGSLGPRLYARVARRRRRLECDGDGCTVHTS